MGCAASTQPLQAPALTRFPPPPAPPPAPPAGTEACASVTSAFLQVLATIQRVEAARSDHPRNVLQVGGAGERRRSGGSGGGQRWAVPAP